MAVERVLVVGATGNIGASAVIAALRSGREVLAVVRNQASAEKLFKNVGKRDGLTTVEADVMSPDGIQSVVDRVKKGEVKPFQHVCTSVGAWRDTPMQQVSDDYFRDTMRFCFEANFFVYRATLPYLLEQKNPNSSFTVCVGSADKSGFGALTAVCQAALGGMVNVAISETKGTNVRVNEMYLNIHIEVDHLAEERHSTAASSYANVYEAILNRPEIDGCSVRTMTEADLDSLPFEKKLIEWGRESHRGTLY